jgi:hypothetical protein
VTGQVTALHKSTKQVAVVGLKMSILLDSSIYCSFDCRVAWYISTGRGMSSHRMLLCHLIVWTFFLTRKPYTVVLRSILGVDSPPKLVKVDLDVLSNDASIRTAER